MRRNAINYFHCVKTVLLLPVCLLLFTQMPLFAESKTSPQTNKPVKLVKPVTNKPVIVNPVNPVKTVKPVKAAKPAPVSADISAVKKVGGFPFYVYKDAYSKRNHFFPSGWMGDFDDMSYNNAWTNNPQSGKTCFRIKYTAKGSRGNGWAGIYWQDPINNWDVGKLTGGYDLTGAKKIKFYARGEKGGEIVEFQVGGMTSGKQTTGPLQLEKEWVQYEMSIKEMELAIVNGGFNAVYTRADNPNGCIFYVDEIYFTDSN